VAAFREGVEMVEKVAFDRQAKVDGGSGLEARSIISDIPIYDRQRVGWHTPTNSELEVLRD
jgi:hypothetical protein